ncbi:MAG: DUF1800 domain-containing protein [Saprospiraceae bacterium]|nr:DUF1800 domain-containing protein [Saprospiraceae bacterium]MCB0542823.1 DUF1800 domain-containing protein [Saprospiraceae bacterium]MCB0573494.1 DUF1800 domain-containing protein [Saprospiraceae bacterium]MCB9355840.1 DUF1800 domain-containing protein [Lewinellaceae bacterium]
MPAIADQFAANTHQSQPENAVAGPLDPYVPSAAKPWNERRVAHLYRRLGYGATYDQIQQGLQMSPSALVDQLFDNAAALAPPAPPVWANWSFDQYNGDFSLVQEHVRELRRRWLADMLNEGIRAKMAFFWHDHFVAELMIYTCNSWMWDYYSLLHEKAFGNFRDFAREMGKSAAMLMYLNGNLNEKGKPNENYARELMELFTMGESNGYTQADIVEMAKALTGWQADDDDCLPPTFNAAKYDTGLKTIFGKTANYDFDQAHDLIFTERPEQVSHYIAGKIYKYFIYQNADQQVVDGMATTFKNGDWELLPMLKELFKSEHFFEEQLINAKLKDPLETTLPLLKMAGGVHPGTVSNDWLDDVFFWAYILGQELFNPPNVSGWKEHRAWINETTLTIRWEYSGKAAGLLLNSDAMRDNLRLLALILTNESNNPVVVTQALVEFFLRQDLEPVHLQAAVLNFKAGIPENYFLDGSWNLYWDEATDQIIHLLQYLVRLPEYQLT